ncbi:hypothetical protein POVCU2_0051450 [Plasmodium ovale curtisi]|uniref:Uncharacterized protein n=1 Tax=Plasmodium ovale curtisi TaxID=864141 RepID=A0A1A8W812_PLAOA|nr:hypothetical protein POVCU2_0051450 [Plasmodium ovale curtisi]SBS98647.1 hypothetical protein POVCU1_047750 [Plasmodium ovale curtisi]
MGEGKSGKESTRGYPTEILPCRVFYPITFYLKTFGKYPFIVLLGVRWTFECANVQMCTGFGLLPPN